MTQKLVIPFGDHKIVAEINDADSAVILPELTIYLCDNNDIITQDICCVRQFFEYDAKRKEFVKNNNFVSCLVYGDSQNEDYTANYTIEVYRDEEE